MQAEQVFFVGIQDVGEENRITNKALLEALTNTANVHGNIIGQSTADREFRRLSWVVLNWKLRVLRRPVVCESFLVRTWAQECTRVQARRDYDVFDMQGERIALATSAWAAVDTERGELVRLTPEIMDGYGPEPEHQNFPGFHFLRKVKDQLPPIDTAEFRICKSMIDCNRHVHNPAYLDMAQEILPAGTDAILFDNVEVCYKREIKPGQTVLLEYARDDGRHCVLIRDPADGGLHAMIFLY